jgi:hypothetical protein
MTTVTTIQIGPDPDMRRLNLLCATGSGDDGQALLERSVQISPASEPKSPTGRTSGITS